eukprot:TRINITY_DN27935_c0_g1_i1.p1 TRINITY_DN27935_c0_g1~~TRINITY_DN27935_c0_g1_i1.p1  ORF type:complete len:5156 (-),score=1260.04 TRINITY_DN27935_c0_g1_i1:82-15549(-)
MFPLELDAYEAGCAPLHRPPALDLFGAAAISFVIAALLAGLTDFIPWKLRDLPQSMQWRARATFASLQQPIGMAYLLPPSEALGIVFTSNNPWTISATRNLWLALFYLFGAWFFELLVLLHPATGARKSYGKRGWFVQVAHHVGFPAFALHNVLSGCAVPGTAIACYSELTVLFTSSFWIAKMAGFGDIFLLPIRWGMVVSTIVLRGIMVLILDFRAVLNDQSALPYRSWLVQCCALVGTNVLNLLILRLVQGAVMRGSEKAGSNLGAMTSLVGMAVRFVMMPLGPVACERLLNELLQEPAMKAEQDSSRERPPKSLSRSLSENLSRLFRRQPQYLDEPEAEAAPSPTSAAKPQTSFEEEASEEVQPVSGRSRDELRELMIRLAADSAGFAVEADKPLLDSGMDSKAAVQFSAKLSKELPGLRLPSTLVFDYPTLSAVAGYAEESMRPKRSRPTAAAPTPRSMGSNDEPLAIVGAACAFPGSAGSPAKFGSLLAMGVDSVVEVPFTRWELDEYYDPNPDAPGKMYPRHAAFIEGAEEFANAYFGITAPEVRAMDPQQRLVLEVSHDCMLDSNMKRETLVGSDVAAIVGFSNNDWIQVQSGDIRKINPYTATGTSASVAAARVAYCLGLKGPAYIVDTACSSALVALDSAAMNVRRGRARHGALSAAANVICSPATFVSFSKPRMLSPRGRCFTFDASADGYGRGEGGGAVNLRRLLDAHGLARAALRGIAVNQDGMSSTMTAPNGPSQTLVVATALQEAKMQHSQVTHMECHGTGTPLGDPIEIGALQAGSMEQGGRSQPLAVAAVKSIVGHLEGSAASPGLLKTVALLQRRAALPTLHLRALNPHLSQLQEVPQVFPTEHMPLLPSQQGLHRTGALSSFGFGGTNAHAILGESEVPVDLFGLEHPADYKKKAFPWREVGYRLLRRHPDDGTFEVTMSADVFDVVAHHVVFGSIVTPGVVYVEMALEATRKLFGQGVQLKDVTMVFPFVVPQPSADGSQSAPTMRFVLKGDKRFEIQSMSAAGKVTSHVEAALDRNAPQVVAEPRNLDELQGRINEPVSTAAVYDAINSVGLYLGPMFQVAKKVWRKETETSCEVLGMLELDYPGVKNAGYLMHPALLDGTIHILATASIGKDVGGLKIFGGVGRVVVVRQENFSKLERYWVHLDITESLEASQTFNVTVMAEDGSVLMLMDDVVFRAVKPEQIQMAIAAQGARDDEQKSYEVEWSVMQAEGSTPAGSDKYLVLVDDNTQLSDIREKLGDSHTYVNLSLQSSSVPYEDMTEYQKVISVTTSCDTETIVEALARTLEIMKALAKLRGGAPELWLVTCSTQSTKIGDMAGVGLPLHAGLWGLARAFRNEHPDRKVLCFDVGQGMELSGTLHAHLQAAGDIVGDPEIAARRKSEEGEATQELLVPRLLEATEVKLGEQALECQETGSYVISGGLGALGLIFARWLLERKAKNIALLSRSGKPPPDCRVAFKRLASKVTVHKADISSASDTLRVMKLVKDELGSVRGIVHAAGSLDDHMIVDLERSHLEGVLAPKVDGTLNLSKSVSDEKLDFFACFSSVAALLGTPAQANYCAANAFMDAFVSHQRDNGHPAVSVQWGPWAEVGMAARAGTSETSIARIEASKGLEAMEAILASQRSLRSGVIGVARIKWKTLLGQLPRVPAFLSRFSSSSAKAPAVTGNYTQEDVKALVVGSLADVLGSDDFDLSTPLMELGLDSLAGVEFRNRLQGAVDGIQLTPTLMFDYPTVPDLVEYIWSQVGPAEDEELLGGMQAGGVVGEQLALAGHSGRFPGSSGNHPGELWQTLSSGLDTTAELPPERWDMDAFFDPDPDVPGKTYVKLGHFIPGIEQFDGEFFGLSEMEQRGMDPHQWLTLEVTYDGMYAAGLTKETMNGMDCGVYVGCATLGGIEPDIPAFGPFTNIGYAYSGLSGRVSHTLSLRGPCFTVDTACSSTVVALDCANQAVRIGRCKSAVASGVNVQLSAAIWVGFAKMRGLAMDGNCKTFDVSADGFARGEGMGAVYVEVAGARGSEAVPAAALLGGVATNHDGRAATITAPNGTAQQRVLRAALAERGTRPEAVGCLECHGTGTALGDPIEVGGQKAVYGKGREADQPLVLAAGKTNLGHLEGAAGVAGLSKAVLSIQRAQIPPALWLRQLNNNIDFTGFHALTSVELLDWRKTKVREVGVSSFGFSGTNGHALVEGAPLETTKEPLKRPAAVYSRRLLQPYTPWLQELLFQEEWVAADERDVPAWDGRACLVLGTAKLPGAVELKGRGQSREEIREALSAANARAAVFVADAIEEAPGQQLLDLLAFLQAAQVEPPLDTLLVVTRHAQDTDKPDSRSALWGLARSARLEMLRTSVKLLDVGPGTTPDGEVQAVQRMLAGEELEASCSEDELLVPRLQRATAPASALQRKDMMREAGAASFADGVAVVTGGLGGLGMLAAQQLAELGAPQLALASRSGRPGAGLEGRLARLQSFPGTAVHLKCCDTSSGEQVSSLMKGLRDLGPVRAVVHAAGVLDRCSLSELDAPRMDVTVGPKARGAWHLHKEEEGSENLQLFLLFSSVSSTLGLSGGAAYAAANAYLDGLALWRQRSSQPGGGMSLKFGPVAEIGMTAAAGEDKQLEGMSLKALPLAQVASALRLVLAPGSPRQPSLALPAELMLARANWAAYARDAGGLVPQLGGFLTEEVEASSSKAGKAGPDAALAKLPSAERESTVLRTIRETANGMGLDIQDESPLMEAGIDSLSAVEFRGKISTEFRSVRLPSTLMFDHPTLKALAKHISSELATETVSQSAVAVAAPTLGKAQRGASGRLAVVGAACNLPGDCRKLQSLSAALSFGTDCISEVPYSRWDMDAYYDPEAPTGLEMYVRHAGFTEGAELFDAQLFNISKPEAEAMDPQQRHLLETALSAFVDAGFSKASLMGLHGGAFVGQDKCDWNRMLSAAHAGPFAATGGSASISSNRISYSLGIKGPSATVDTACSSSLVAADTAAATLRRGRCDVAVICGVNMLLLPQTFVACCQARMLSADGRCHTFDSAATGYARGEGCGAKVLLPRQPVPAITNANQNPSTPLASLIGSALNQDGRSANLTSPNGPSQESVVLTALAEAGIAPEELSQVETHGTGTELGDPIEVGALQAALGGSGRSRPLALGAVKTNIGHLEGGAGMAGLLKLASQLRQPTAAAPNLHLHSLNRHIFEDTQDFAVLFGNESLAARTAKNASVSSFGFGGTNGHVVLQAPSDSTAQTKAPSQSAAPKLPRAAFLFTGQGSQYVDMGKALYEKETAFREAMDRCARVLDDLLPKPLLEVMYPAAGAVEGEATLLDDTQFSQPAIFALEYALSELWRSKGLVPCAVMGHSVGEYCAAVVAGVMSLEDGLRLIAARGRTITSKCAAGEGSMVAIFAPEAEVAAAISSAAVTEVSIAAVNGPKMTVLSGRSSEVDSVVAKLSASNRKLNVSHAFHSPLMGPALDPFRKDAEAVAFGKPSIPFFSTLLGKQADEELASTQYWVDHIPGTVRFSKALEVLQGSIQPEVYLEIGAQPTLVNMAKRIISKGPSFMTSLDPKAPELWQKNQATLGLQRTESPIDSERHDRPEVEFRRQAFPWREPGHPLIRKKSTREDGAACLSCPIDGHVLELLSHHIVHGEVVVPGACYLEMILAGVAAHLGQKEAWCIESLGFAKPLVLRLSADGQLEEPVELRLLIWPDGRLEVESEVGEDPEDSIVSTHVEASLTQLKGGWQANRVEKDRQDLTELRESCPEHVDIDLMYSFGVKSGLPLQRRFRAVRQVQVQKSERMGFGRLEMERDGTHLGFLLGPSLIDSSFQALMALADPAVGIGSLKIPLSIKRLQPTGRAFSIGVWSHFQLLDWTEHSTVFRSWLMNEAGETVLYFDSVHLQEVRDEHLQKVLQASGRLGAEQQALYTTEWRATTSEAAEVDNADGEHEETKARWLILGSQEDLRCLQLEKDTRCRCVTHGEGQDSMDFRDEAALQELLQEEWQAIVFAGVASQSSDVEALELALHLLRAASAAAGRRGSPLPLWIVTHRAQPLACSACEEAIGPAHAGLWGFARSARLEEPDRLSIVCLDLETASGPLGTDLTAALEAALKQQNDGGRLEEELAFRPGVEKVDSELCCSRLVRSAVRARGPIRLNMPFRGSLTGLRPVPQTMRQPMVPGSAQLRVRAVGLNFRDVLNVMGLYPGDPGPPGADCSGTVLEVGERVEHIRPGEDIFGEAPGCLSTYCLAPAALLTQKPTTWSYEEASTMPVIFVTVEEALGDLAKLKRGERVLVHAAAGGVGLVAIQYAKFVGAEVYATAGAEEKHEFLRSLGVKYITSSRNGAKFEEDMRRFLKEEGADGVDVVLNSLSHDGYIPRSLALLRKGGRFMEIGKRGVWSHEQMWKERPDVMYEKIAADTMMEKESWRYNAYLKRLIERVDAGGLEPINMHLFQELEEGVAALQFLQKAQNIGKVVITQASRMMCRPEGTQLLSGGTGALGIVAAQFLVEEGAKSLCLLSRGGRPPAEVQARWDWLQAAAVQVTVSRCDVSDEAAVSAVGAQTKGSFASLLHLAGALADGMLPNLSRDMFQKSYGPKVHGLHYLCQHVKFEEGAPFVLFSSTSSLFGSPGQGNYAAANCALDALAPYWTRCGQRHAVAVQWGPWAEVGMAAQKGTVQRAKASGIGSLSNSQGMAILGSVLRQQSVRGGPIPGETLVGAAHVRWAKFLRTAYDAGAPRFLEDLEAEAARTAAAEGSDEPGSGLAAVVAALAPEERAQALQDAVRRLAREVVGDDELSGDAPLLESGMDSLSGVEFRNRLQQELGGIRIPNSAVFDYPTADALAGFIAGQFESSSQVQAERPAAAAQADAPARLLERLNERTAGQPLFLIPGAGLQAGGFQALAELLPVPAYGISWPKESLPRERWPSSLSDLASLLLQEVQAVQPSGPYFFAGHSFGASVCLEMARQAEAAGEQVALAALLDPRSLLPVVDLGAASKESGILETVALLSQTVAEGSRYAAQVEELSGRDPASHVDALRSSLGPAALAMLEHVHETFRWYASLLGTGVAADSLKARVVLLRAAEAWLEEPKEESQAERIVRQVQADVFQRDDEVVKRLTSWGSSAAAAAAAPLRVTGGHFAMLHEPNVVKTALMLCHSLVEADA